MPLFSGLAGATARGMSGAAEIERQRRADAEAKEQREIQMMAQMMGLREMGVMPEQEAPTVSDDSVIQGFQGMKPRAVASVRTPRTDPNYKPIGSAGGQRYVQGPKPAEIVAQRKQEETIRKRTAVLRALPQHRGADPEALQAIAMDDDAWREAIKPQKPQAPVRGTPEYLEALKAEEAIKAQNDRGPAGSFVPMLRNGRPVFYNPTTGEEREAPEGMASGNATAINDKAKRVQAVDNAAKGLAALRQSLETTGSTIMPGVDKSVLQTEYENLQLQLKELYNLGVLNGPDLALMRRIINDPTSLRGRAESFGSGKEQTRRAIAQVDAVVKKLEGFRETAMNAGQIAQPAAESSTPDVSALMKKYGLEP